MIRVLVLVLLSCLSFGCSGRSYRAMGSDPDRPAFPEAERAPSSDRDLGEGGDREPLGAVQADEAEKADPALEPDDDPPLPSGDQERPKQR
jgi:hypothetical protein